MVSKKSGKKLSKLIDKSDSDEEGSGHELSFYVNDRVKLMKEVLKIIKPKKIKSMAPYCLKNTKTEELNSMLLEELLGISNKRLKYIFSGQNLDEDSSSSTDPEEEKPPIDIISLDDISDDDFIDLDSDDNSKYKKKRSVEPKKKRIKKEKHAKPKTEEENLMSVLELLELQARARAIRSQLYLESTKKVDDNVKERVKIEDSDPEDAVIIEDPKQDEIVITTSESENEETTGNGQEKNEGNCEKKNDEGENGTSSVPVNDMKIEDNPLNNLMDKSDENEGLVINVDQSEMDCIICD